jgi:hypothetical protein
MHQVGSKTFKEALLRNAKARVEQLAELASNSSDELAALLTEGLKEVARQLQEVLDVQAD